MPDKKRRRRRLPGLPKIRVLPVLVSVVALFFLVPWMPEPPAGGALDRYSPVRDGGSSLVETYGPDGRLLSTESQNLAVIPPLRSFVELREGPREVLERLHASPEEMDSARVIELRRRTVKTSGELSQTTDTLLLDGRGLLLLASREGTGATETVFDPPALLLPADLGPESRWSSKGRFGALDYALSGRVLDSGSFEGALGRFDDCLEIEARAIFSGGASEETRTTFRERYCAGVGLVESREFDGSGKLLRHSATVSTDRVPARREVRLRPAPLANGRKPSGDPENWRLIHLGRARPSGEATTSTIPPTYVPTDPPAVLAAAQEGDLVALDAGSQASGSVRWRFNPDGDIYGPPALDRRTGRVYFGATDKRLYALDARGLFLWSFQAEDNIASRPAIAGDVVIFGSEDRNVYGVEATTGEERWRLETGGPVVSSPALAAGVAVIGSDDGAVYGIDPATGKRRWLHLTEGPIEAPVVAADGVAYVASRSGELVALDAESGEEIWTSAPADVLRTAAAVGPSAVFAVDDNYDLLAFDRETGRKLWEVLSDSYAGPPLLAGGEILVASQDGYVDRFGPGGERRGRLDAPGSPIDGNPGFSLGPTAGGGVAWVAASTAAVLRMGPESGPAHIQPAWAAPFSAPPFSGEAPQYTGAEYRGDALLLGSGNGIYLVDPESGAVRKTGALEAGAGSPVSEPVVAGDTLLAASGDALHAAALPDGERLWSFKGGRGLRPPVVAGGRVLWLPANGDGATGILRTFDLDTGKPLWKTVLDGAGGVIVRRGIAYANPAAAFDIESGRELWRVEIEGSATGGPALSESGDTLFVGTVGEEVGYVTALEAESGERLWQTELKGEAVSVSDRLWTSGDALIVPSISGSVISLDAETGGELWRYEPHFPRLGNITVKGGRVWLALQNGEVLVLDAQSGKLAARSNDYSLNLSASSLSQRPVLVGGRLVLGVGSYALGFEPPREASGP
ncbi:MAG: PQQ-binding-like beta-propeller repeat protein [Actinomycetota bacterium]